MSDVDVVREIYVAFSRKDLDRVLELCDPECVVTQDPALPWGGTHIGPDGVATFAITLASTIDSTVTVHEIYQAGDRVVQYGRTAGTVVANAAPFDVPEAHVWTVRDGKVVAADFYIDSEAMLAAIAQPS